MGGNTCTPIVIWWLNNFGRHLTHPHHWMAIEMFWLVSYTSTPFDGDQNFLVAQEGRWRLIFIYFSKMTTWLTPLLVIEIFWLPSDYGGVSNGDWKNSITIQQTTIVRWWPTKAFQKHMTCPPFVVTNFFSIDAALLIEKFQSLQGWRLKKFSFFGHHKVWWLKKIQFHKVGWQKKFNHQRVYGNPNGSSFHCICVQMHPSHCDGHTNVVTTLWGTNKKCLTF
jgi:hypothetical protein